TEEYTVLEAENGKEGLKIATKILPDLILSDIIMPEMNGISLGKAIKQNEMTSHIPFILLTAKMGQSSKKAAFEAGADAYLSKPFNQEELKLRIQNLLNSRKSLKEKYTQVIKLEPFEIEIENKDEVFFRKIREIIERNLSNPDFNIARLCEEMNLSRYQFYRKFKTISEQKPVDFIIAYRMKRAVDLLKDKDIRIKEVMAMTGFNSASSFIKNFKKIYGVSPSDYLDNLFHE
ncbi:MAG: response regulator, partial [bacterium]